MNFAALSQLFIPAQEDWIFYFPLGAIFSKAIEYKIVSKNFLGKQYLTPLVILNPNNWVTH